MAHDSLQVETPALHRVRQLLQEHTAMLDGDVCEATLARERSVTLADGDRTVLWS